MKKQLSKFRGFPALILLCALQTDRASAQSQQGEPETRKAIPVPTSNQSASQNPVPVLKAIPVNAMGSPDDTDAKNVRRTDTDGSIRLAPVTGNDPEARATAQLSVADGFYTRKQTDSAIPEYEKFLVMASVNTPGRERALYRLAESQRQMGSLSSAENSFLRQIGDYPSGDFAPSASYRLGELREKRSEYANAADNFAFTAGKAKDPAIRLAALYHEALCLEKTNRQKEAMPLFESVAAQKDAGDVLNPYRFPTLMHLAALEYNNGEKERSLGRYQEILSSQKNGEIFCEAALKAAQLQVELGHNEEAEKLFARVASSPDSGRWKEAAGLASLRLAAQSGNHAAIVKAADAALVTNKDARAEILLLRGDSLRKSGKADKALEDYETILREYPVSKEANTASFQRLLALYALKNAELLAEIDHYLLTASDPSDRARAVLLKAESNLSASKYAEAAELYEAIQLDALPATARPDILYKEAWALSQVCSQSHDNGTGEKDTTSTPSSRKAMAALSKFLDTYPNDERSPAALAERGMLNLQQKNLDAAFGDFDQLQKHYPQAKERELALQQMALLLGQQQKNKQMSETFELLLRDYPKSTAAPEAHYWIGVTALDGKDFNRAVAELSEARKGDPKQFGDRAGRRILLARFQQNDYQECAREAGSMKTSLIPPQVAQWLGVNAMKEGKPAQAERFLAPLVKEGMPGATDSESLSTLAASLIAQGKTKEAQIPAAACLKLAKDPAARARALLVTASIQQSLKNFSAASSMVDEAKLLQPEGPLNAEAGILSGDLLASRKDYEGAAKAYMLVALLNDDGTFASRALAKAADAYQKAGNDSEAEKAREELQKRFPNAAKHPKNHEN